jgi:hydroxypyruvate isomerase
MTTHRTKLTAWEMTLLCEALNAYKAPGLDTVTLKQYQQLRDKVDRARLITLTTDAKRTS